MLERCVGISIFVFSSWFWSLLVSGFGLDWSGEFEFRSFAKGRYPFEGLDRGLTKGCGNGTLDGLGSEYGCEDSLRDEARGSLERLKIRFERETCVLENMLRCGTWDLRIEVEICKLQSGMNDKRFGLMWCEVLENRDGWLELKWCTARTYILKYIQYRNWVEL